jgi:hypothetical protein
MIVSDAWSTIIVQSMVSCYFFLSDVSQWFLTQHQQLKTSLTRRQSVQANLANGCSVVDQTAGTLFRLSTKIS